MCARRGGRRARRWCGPARASRPGGPSARRGARSTASALGAGRRRRRTAAARRSRRRRPMLRWCTAPCRCGSRSPPSGRRHDRVDVGVDGQLEPRRACVAGGGRAPNGIRISTVRGPIAHDAALVRGQSVGGACRARRGGAAPGGAGRRGCPTTGSRSVSTGVRRRPRFVAAHLDPGRVAGVDPRGGQLRRTRRAGGERHARRTTATATTASDRERRADDVQLDEAEQPARPGRRWRPRRGSAQPWRVSTAPTSLVGTGTEREHVVRPRRAASAPWSCASGESTSRWASTGPARAFTSSGIT